MSLVCCENGDASSLAKFGRGCRLRLFGLGAREEKYGCLISSLLL